MELRSRLIGVGSYLPEKFLSNHDLSQTLDTTHEWIVERTGISKRHIAHEDELTSDLAVQSAKNALDAAAVSPQTIDLILVATSTPDRTFPSTAVEVQSKLGIRKGFAFDVQAVCSGFLYGLTIVDHFIRNGFVKRALLVGAEIFSRIVNWEDRSSCILFGDGAGAVIIEAEPLVESTKEKGILGSKLCSDGQYSHLLYTDGGPALSEYVGKIHMEGREVFKHAIEKLSSVSLDLLNQYHIPIEEVDWIVPHQANIRILQGVSKKLNYPLEKIITTIDQHANTSAASIPLALDYGVRTGQIKKEDLLLFMAMGAGFTWGASIIRF